MNALDETYFWYLLNWWDVSNAARTAFRGKIGCCCYDVAALTNIDPIIHILIFASRAAFQVFFSLEQLIRSIDLES